MVEHLWTVLCSRSLVDVESQNISLLEVIDEITLPADTFVEKSNVPVNLQIELVTCWRRSNLTQPGKSRARMVLSGPNGKTLEEQAYSVDLTEGPRRRTRIRIPGLNLTGPGTYTFQVELQSIGNGPWMKVAKLPLDVMLNES